MNDPSWVEPATQARSRKTERALRAAAHGLLSERSFEKIRIRDVVERADVSVGTFYRRFRDKRALLHLADEDFLQDCLEAFETAFSDPQIEGKGVQEIVETYVALMISKFREHRGVILEVMRHADPTDASAFGARGEAFNDHVHGRLKELLRERGASGAHDDPEQALNLAIFFASSAARDAIWRENLRAYPVDIDDRGLGAEISRAFVAYLEAPA